MDVAGKRFKAGAFVLVHWKARQKPEACFVSTVKPKGYGVKSMATLGEERHAPEKKVKPGLGAHQYIGTSARLIDTTAAATITVSAIVSNSMLAQPKPKKAARHKGYKDLVHKLLCCNCGRVRAEAHHEGKKGTAQKCSDFLTVPLCLICHKVYTDKNCLPIPATIDSKDIQTRSREESLAILHNEQVRLLSEVFSMLPIEYRIKVLESAMVGADPDELRQALKRIDTELL